MLKLITLRLLAVMMLCVVTTGTGLAAAPVRNVTVNIENGTLKQLFNEIENQTTYRFSYRAALIDNRRNVNVKMSGAPVTKVLEAALKGRDLSFSIVSEKSIVIMSREEAAGKAKPGRTVSGIVYDDNGDPAIGASVMVKGSKNGCSTDIDGRYTLTDVPEGATIIISMIGCTPREIAATDTKALSAVALKGNSEMLDEVVVVGYGTQKKANLTGAVATLNQDEIKDRPTASLGRALQGMIPNLNVTVSSGQPGSGASLNIRGTTSPNGGSPLILVDGVEMNLDRINANDVESVTVLKDASSAAIYGARGAFGVVLVTTKSGQTDKKPEVTYSGSFSISKPTTSTDYETRGYYSAKIADFFLMAAQNTPYTSYTAADYQALWERRNDKTENPARPWVITEERNGRQQYVYLANFDWYNYMFDDSRPTWDHNISIRGGSKTISYLISGRFNQQKGINRLQPDKYKSYNFRVKLNAQLTKQLSIMSNTKFNSSNYTYYGYESEYNNFRKPTLHALASMVPLNPDGTPVSHTSCTNSSAHYLMDGYNAMLQKGKSGGHNLVREFATQFEATYKFNDKFNVKADFSYTFGSLRNDYRSVNVQYSQYPGVLANETEGNFPNSYKEVVWDQHYYVADAYATYNNTWNDAHNLTVIGGVNYEAKYYRDLTAKNTDLLSEDLNDFNLAMGTDNFSITGGKNEYAIMGFFYRAAYNYKGKYLFEVNGRYDGTSRFPRGKRYGFFPSFSAGYRISEEKFFEPLRNVFDNVKIRGSYGSLGNQQIGYYDFIQTISTRGLMSGYSFNGTSLGQHATVSDPVSGDQTWEKVETKNLGLDLSVLNNRLSFTGEVYTRDVKGILSTGRSLPSIYGAKEPQVNANDLRTKGYELVLTWNDSFRLGSHRFNYSVSASFSDYTSEYTKCDNPSGLLGDPYVGKKAGEIWGYRVDGLFRNDEEAAEYASRIDMKTVAPGCYNATGTYGMGVRGGDLKYLDLNNDGIINGGKSTTEDSGDRVIIGNSTPRYHYGINLSAEWFGIDLSVFFQGIGKQDWYPGADNLRFWGPYARPYATFIPRNFMSEVWSEDNPNAYYPRARAYSSLNTTSGTVYYTNDRYLQDLAYCRLKNLTIGYTLPKKLTQKAYIQNCRVYVSGENLFTWTKLHGDFVDPEQISADSDKKANVYPWSKTFAVGLNITF